MGSGYDEILSHLEITRYPVEIATVLSIVFYSQRGNLTALSMSL
jgi:hypothetical protein